MFSPCFMYPLSLMEDGASLATLVRRCGGVTRSLLVLEDTGGGVFGCVLSGDEWRAGAAERGGPRMQYYGSGTVRVFTFQQQGEGEETTPKVELAVGCPPCRSCSALPDPILTCLVVSCHVSSDHLVSSSDVPLYASQLLLLALITGRPGCGWRRRRLCDILGACLILC